MRYLIVVMLIVAASISALSQGKQRKIPTQKELEAMKAKMQKALDNMTPEQKREMQQMGIEMPGAQIDNALAIARSSKGSVGGFPKLDAAKVAAIPPTPSGASLPGFLRDLNAAVAQKLGSELDAQAAELLEVLKNETSDPTELGKGATGLWLAGEPEWALLVAGKVCALDPTYADNLNNYAALLTMMDAQHLAVPLLSHLSSQYSGNPTILSNLGQAWFGLGDIRKSEMHLDSAIQRFPMHSQANETKSEIQEEHGDKKGAIESLKKSLESGYTTEKETRLRRLGYPVGDVSWPLHIPQDPMGHHRFVLPDFPATIEDCAVLEPQWLEFRENVQKRKAELREKHERAGVEMGNEGHDMWRKRQAALKNGRVYIETGPLQMRAGKKLAHLMSSPDDGMEYRLAKLKETSVRVGKELKALKDTRDARMKTAFKGLDCGNGEGSSGEDLEKCCRKENEINNDYLLASNTLIREMVLDVLKEHSRMDNMQAYFFQYSMPPKMFEWKKLELQLSYLDLLEQISPKFERPGVFCEPKRDSVRPFKPGRGLAEFDEIACKYHSIMNLGILKIETHCSRMTTKIDVGKAKLSFTENLNKNHGILPGSITAGSLDASVGIGTKGIGKWGPVKAEVGADVNLHVEFSDQGITEVVANVSVKAEVKTDMFDKAEKVGKILKQGEYEVENAIKYMEETGNTALFPGVADKSVSIGGNIGTITINAGRGVITKGGLSGVKMK